MGSILARPGEDASIEQHLDGEPTQARRGLVVAAARHAVGEGPGFGRGPVRERAGVGHDLVRGRGAAIHCRVTVSRCGMHSRPASGYTCGMPHPQPETDARRRGWFLDDEGNPSPELLDECKRRLDAYRADPSTAIPAEMLLAHIRLTTRR